MNTFWWLVLFLFTVNFYAALACIDFIRYVKKAHSLRLRYGRNLVRLGYTLWVFFFLVSIIGTFFAVLYFQGQEALKWTIS